MGMSARPASKQLPKFEEKVKHQMEGLQREQFMRGSDAFALRPLEEEAEDAVVRSPHPPSVPLVSHVDCCYLPPFPPLIPFSLT